MLCGSPLTRPQRRSIPNIARPTEVDEIQHVPQVERREIRDIFAGKGFSGELLERVVDTITSNRDRWVDTMMQEELHLQPVENLAIFRSAIVITIAALIGHLIPLAPFLLLPRMDAPATAIVLSGIVLFGVGVYSAVSLIGDWRISGLRMMIIGLGAAGLGFLVGRLFHTVA